MPLGKSEAGNVLIRQYGECTTQKQYNHVDLMKMLNGLDCSEKVTRMSGGRSYVLRGELVLLHVALLHFAMQFLVKKGYTPFYPPVFLTKGSMREVAQLSDFEDQLYKMTGEGEDKYLIATSEQPLCAYHRNQWFSDEELRTPLRYAGYSSCFRKEVGTHGRDTLGAFRVHQFEKIEQFVVCSPREDMSWRIHEEMIRTSEEFYQTLNLPHRVVDVASGALNNAAARKYDLEGWFSGSQKFQELVSCTHCTDYQSRRIGCRYGNPSQSVTTATPLKEHPHMLNATLCALPRTLCCLIENYQTKEGIEIPEILRSYVPSIGSLMRFTVPPPCLP